MFIVLYSIQKYLMKFTDIVKLKTSIVMFKASKNTLTNIIQKLFICGRKHTFIRKIRTDRKSFCISIIGPQLWNYYYMINIKKILSLIKIRQKMFLKFY